MNLKYPIAALGIMIGLNAYLSGRPVPVEHYTNNHEHRKIMLSKCTEGQKRGKNCDNARMAEFILNSHKDEEINEYK